jgi:hypothetical protein
MKYQDLLREKEQRVAGPQKPMSLAEILVELHEQEENQREKDEAKRFEAQKSSVIAQIASFFEFNRTETSSVELFRCGELLYGVVGGVEIAPQGPRGVFLVANCPNCDSKVAGNQLASSHGDLGRLIKEAREGMFTPNDSHTAVCGAERAKKRREKEPTIEERLTEAMKLAVKHWSSK